MHKKIWFVLTAMEYEMTTNHKSNFRLLLQILILSVVIAVAFDFMAGATNVYKVPDKSGLPAHPGGKALILAKGSLQRGMTKKEAYDIEGVPYRVVRVPDEEDKEVWVYRCMNSDGFNDDCKYLYFDGNELVKIERP